MMARLAVLACVGLLAASCGSGSDTQDSVGESTATTDASSVTAPEVAASVQTEQSDGDDGTAVESPTSTPDSVPVLSARDLPANPLPISFIREEGAASTALIDETGGRLEAQDAAGVTYELVVPAGALRASQSITMTPIDVAESALEEITVSAVAFEPDGLVLLESATLSIHMPASLAEGAAAFVTDGGGDNFRLKVASLGATTTISVPHFSETGVAEASRAEFDKLRDNYRPGDREGRYQQEIETVVARVADPTAREEALTSVFVDWFDAIAQSAATASGPEQVDQLFGELLAADDELEHVEAFIETTLSGVGTAIVEAGVAVQAAIFKMFEQANLRCIQNKDLNEIFQMLRWGYLHLFIFEPMALSGDNRVDQFRQAINACATYEVKFESAAAGNAGDGGFSAQVQATVPLRFDIASGDLFLSQRRFKSPEARADLIGIGVTSSDGGDASCSSRAEIAVVLDLDLQYPDGGAISEARVNHRTLLIRFPEKVTWTCTAAQGDFNVGEAFWTPWFISLEGSRLDGGVFDFPLPNSNPNQYQNDGKEGDTFISVKITLEHTPQLP